MSTQAVTASATGCSLDDNTIDVNFGQHHRVVKFMVKNRFLHYALPKSVETQAGACFLSLSQSCFISLTLSISLCSVSYVAYADVLVGFSSECSLCLSL